MVSYRGPERRRHRWLDWRMIASLGFVLLVVLVFYAVWSSAQARDQAFESLTASRAAATRRVDLLTAEIHALQASSENNGAQIAQLQAQIEALRQQLIKAGIQPVVPAQSRSPHPSSSPTPSPRPSPSPSPTKRPHPTPTPKPSPTCLVPPLVCP